MSDEQPEAEAPENVVEAVADATPTPKVTVVKAAVPSSQNEAPADVPEAPPTLPLAAAVAALLVFVKAHRTAGDADLEVAVAAVEDALAAQA